MKNRQRLQLAAVLAGILLGGVGCAGKAAAPDTPFPEQIGMSRATDLDQTDAYEQVVGQIVSHIEDGVRVLSLVQDERTAKQAAGMFLEASDRVVDLRRQMLERNPRDVIPPSVLVSYGPRYFFARFETEQQLKRIKALDAEVHRPLKSVLTRLDDRVKQVEEQYEQAKDRTKRGG